MSYEIVDATYVLDNLGKMPIVDVRPDELYQAGHIPGAVSAGLLKAKEASGNTAEVFVEEMKAVGVAPEDDPIVYCQQGHLAKEACDLLESLGYTGQKCYEGSWGDWISDPTRPIEK